MLPASTVFYITDNGWNNTSSSFPKQSEGTWSFQVGERPIPAGTPIIFPNANGSSSTAVALGSWSRVRGSFSLSASGEVIYVHTKDISSSSSSRPPGTDPGFVCAVSIGNAGGFSPRVDSNTGDCPTSLGGNDALTHCLEFRRGADNAMVSSRCVDGDVRGRLNGPDAGSEYVFSNDAFYSTVSSVDAPVVKLSPDACPLPPPPPSPPPARSLNVNQVQGAGNASPFDGARVELAPAVVTYVMGVGSQRGFHMQNADADADNDGNTSEGIFVSTTTNGVAIGDVVAVSGVVSERFGLTQIAADAIVVLASGARLPTPVTVRLDELPNLEAFESMVIAVADNLVISDSFNLGRFGEVLACAGGQRPAPFTQTNPPQENAPQPADALKRCIRVDDGKTAQNVAPILLGGLSEYAVSSPADAFARLGNELVGVVGVLSYAFSAFRILPSQRFDIVVANGRPATTPFDSVPAALASIKVFTSNMLNYYTTIDESGARAGPSCNGAPRGADSAAELERQRDKLLSTFIAADADVLVLIEVQNGQTCAPSGATQASADLVARLNASPLGTRAQAPRLYGAASIVRGVPQVDVSDSITADILWDSTRFEAVENTDVYVLTDAALSTLGFEIGPTRDGLFDGVSSNRAPIAVTLTLKESGEEVTVVGVHLKSKGSACTRGNLNDPNVGNGEGNCPETRRLASDAIRYVFMARVSIERIAAVVHCCVILSAISTDSHTLTILSVYVYVYVCVCVCV